MQSFFQYRRSGRLVQEQLDRKEKLAAKPEPHANDPVSDTPSHLDPEKAERPLEGQAQNTAKLSEQASRDPEKQNGELGDLEKVDQQLSYAREQRKDSVESIESPQGSPETASFGKEVQKEAPHELGVSVSRVSTRSQRTLRTKLGRTLTDINVRDRTTKEGGEDGGRQVFVVGFEGDKDPTNPHNWPFWQRLRATGMVACIGAIVGVASAIDASILTHAAKDFHVSEVAESLATGIFLTGFGVGALFAGPISETLGRNPVYIATLSLYMVFVMASGLAPNFGAQITFRFLAGVFASTPLTCAGGSIADMWDSFERIITFPVFANAAFMGPIFGPIIGGWVALGATEGKLSWRWTEWLTLILSGLVLGLVVFFQPETYTPIILKWKAAHLRRLTGDDRYCADIEIRQESLFTRIRVALYRPFIMTAQEPIIILIALYLSVVYIILFTFLDGYDYIFAGIHGTNEGITGICFLGIALGLCVSSAFVPLVYKWAKMDLKKIREQGGDKLPPEFRLWYAMLGGSAAIPISLFWMGWTSDSSISIWSPLIASVFFGYGILAVFISSYQYIIDSYEIFAASALASVTLFRYAAAGGMVVVGIPFYKNVGVHYTLTILGCISTALVPVPYVFFRYGKKIRSYSRYAIAGKQN
ncbi:MAG: hypothetical protein M1828_002937 [Chrysothrix sp. TS-e1954]|nr:MAG: hypothetical protein M1828_002937 [Chrysothrix sp. TS-e1954]